MVAVEQGRRRGPARPGPLDLALAAVATALPVGDLLLDGHRTGDVRDLAAVSAVLVAGGSLLLRRRAPVTVLLVTASCAVLALLPGHRTPTPVLPCTVALFTVAETGDRRRSLLAGGAAAVTGALAGLVEGEGPGLEMLGHAALLACPVALGELVRMQRAALAMLRERAELAARARDDEHRRRVDEERHRIARDLHDGVAHALTTIAVQAGAAGHLLQDRPEFARDALAEIGAASREALREVRAVVAMLREGVDGDDGPMAPGPGLAQVADLVETARREGLPVRTGPDDPAGPRRDAVAADVPASVPASVQVAAFRIVQEALTNVRRHAGRVGTQVDVRVERDALRVRVRNDGPAGPAPEAGPGSDHGADHGPEHGPEHGRGAGLVGMRERAELLGGHLEAGPLPGGGFQVDAVLPFGGSP